MREEARAGSLLMGGIALCVLLVIGAIFAAVWAFDQHYVTRREWELATVQLQKDVGQIQLDVQRIRQKLEDGAATPKPR